jgi:thiol-disulfide isomerase/thioredoxin
MSEKVVEIAESYVGQKEIHGNQGFLNKDFEKKMRAVGFYTGAPWCAFFVKLVWKESDTERYKLIAGSALQTMRNFVKAEKIDLVAKPNVGAIAIYRTMKNGKAQTTGHVAVVIEVGDVTFTTVEGNTNASGGREGIEVAKKYRSYKFYEPNGLQLMGFINF